MAKLKIALLSGINVIHTTRWANALAHRGYDIHLITQHEGGDVVSDKVKIHFLPFKGNKGYFLNVLCLRRLLQKIKPDILHAHYASGYGTLGRLSGYHPFVLSVWGSDVYDFPYESSLKMKLLQKNLKSADIVASTSNVMVKQTHKICKGLAQIYITPFGVDIHSFKPLKSRRSLDAITIGTVKKLNYKYGIDILIKGFAEVRNRFLARDVDIASKLRLLIVGGGKDRDSLLNLADSLDLSSCTVFIGSVPYANVPDYLNRLDIYVAASRLDSESFGVAVLEASACSLPVIVADVGGLPEVVEDGVTGVVIPKENHLSLANAMEKLIINENFRIKMGNSGRQRVIEHYTWEDSVSKMEDVYKHVLKTFK